MAWCEFCEMGYLIEAPGGDERAMVLPEVEPLAEEEKKFDDEVHYEPDPEPSAAEKLREQMIAEQQEFVAQMQRFGAKRRGGRWVVSSLESMCVPGFFGLIAMVVCSVMAPFVPDKALWFFLTGCALLGIGVLTVAFKLLNASKTMELIHDYGERRREQRVALRRLRATEPVG